MGGVISTLLLPLLLFSQTQPQEISIPNSISEGHFYTKEGTLYCDAVVVKFKSKVINMPDNSRTGFKDLIDSKYSNISNAIDLLEKNYGKSTFIKQIPRMKYGETTAVNKLTGKTVQIVDLSQLYTIRFEHPVPLRETIKEFEKLSNVEFVEQPVTILFLDEPEDPKYSEMWNLDVTNAAGAWAITHGNPDVRIAIIDDGILTSHEDLQGHIVYDNSVVGNHGTWVASVAGGVTDNNKGVASHGWNLRLDNYGGAETFADQHLLAGLIDAASLTSHVINMSWLSARILDGVEELMEECPDCNEDQAISTYDQQSEIIFAPYNSTAIQTAINNAVSAGVICVAAVGNTSKNLPKFTYQQCDPLYPPHDQWPAQYANVIAVSGTNRDDKFYGGWNHGPFVDLAAPGEQIWMADINGGYILGPRGTSFSTPQVSAVAGLIRSVAPDMSPAIVQSVLEKTADKVDATRHPYDSNGWNEYLGYGRLNAGNAVSKAVEIYENPPGIPQNFSLTLQTFSTTKRPKLSWNANTEPDFNVYKIERKKETGPWATIATLPIDQTSYIDMMIVVRTFNPKTAYYRMYATDQEEPSLSSAYTATKSVDYFIDFDRNGNDELSEIAKEGRPKEFKLHENYPNPFNPVTHVRYDIPFYSEVTVDIFNTLGQKVKTLVHAKQRPRFYNVMWDATDNSGNNLSTGIYYVRVSVRSLENDFQTVTSGKMILLK